MSKQDETSKWTNKYDSGATLISEYNDTLPISYFCDIALLSSCLMNISKIMCYPGIDPSHAKQAEMLFGNQHKPQISYPLIFV